MEHGPNTALIVTVLVMGLASIVWAVVQRGAQRMGVNGPLLMAILGAAAGVLLISSTPEFVESKLALTLAELGLALILFVDAIDVRGSLRKHFSAQSLRLLLIALPLSVLLILGIGLLLPLDLPIAVVLAIACIAAPVDFAPELSLVRDRRIPPGVRHSLTVESGYNDGLVTPVLLGALALASTVGSRRTDQALSTFLSAAPAGAIAIGVGMACGLLVGTLIRGARRLGWSDAGTARLAVLALPFVAFGLSLAVHGNGFVAAFVSAIGYRLARGAAWKDEAEEVELAEHAGFVVNLLLWLAFGFVAVTLLALAWDWWPAILLAFLSLTVGRFVPVLISLVGTRTPWKDAVFLATMGPRGAASIVFALIAFNALPLDDGYDVLAATSMVILGSLVLHGTLGPYLTRRFYGDRTAGGPVSS